MHLNLIEPSVASTWCQTTATVGKWKEAGKSALYKYQKKYQKILSEEKNLRLAEKTLRLALGAMAMVALIPLSVYIHESGHALAMKYMYNNANPKIYLQNLGFSGGSCSWGFQGPEQLSKIGELIGDDQAKSFVFAAGPLVGIITALAMTVFIKSDIVAPIAYFNSASMAAYSLNDLISITSGSGCGGDFCMVARKSGFVAYLTLTAAAVAVVSLSIKKAISLPVKMAAPQISMLSLADNKSHSLQLSQKVIDEKGTSYLSQLQALKSSMNRLPYKKFLATETTYLSYAAALPALLGAGYFQMANKYPVIHLLLSQAISSGTDTLASVLSENIRPWMKMGVGAAGIGALFLFANRQANKVEQGYLAQNTALQAQMDKMRADLIAHLQKALQEKADQLSEAYVVRLLSLSQHQAINDAIQTLCVDAKSELEDLGFSATEIHLILDPVRQTLQDLKQDPIQLQDSAEGAHVYNAEFLLKTAITPENCLPKSVKEHLAAVEKPAKPSTPAYGKIFGVSIIAGYSLGNMAALTAQIGNAASCLSTSLLMLRTVPTECLKAITPSPGPSEETVNALTLGLMGGVVISQLARATHFFCNKKQTSLEKEYQAKMTTAIQDTQATYDGIAYALERNLDELLKNDSLPGLKEEAHGPDNGEDEQESKLQTPSHDQAAALLSHANTLEQRMQQIEGSLEKSGLDFKAAGIEHKSITATLRASIRRVQTELQPKDDPA